MSFLMDHDNWLQNGSQLFADDPYSYATFPSWEECGVPVLAPINACVTDHSSTTAFDAMDYNMEMDSFSFTMEKSLTPEDDTVMSFDQFCPEVLPGSPEIGSVTNKQLLQYIVQLNVVPDGTQYTDNISPIASAGISTGHQVIPDLPLEWKNFQMTSPSAPDAGFGVMTLPDEMVATVPECEADTENVMDLLNQLSETLNGDTYIDQAKLEAFVSFPLDPLSPDDVESLISSSQLSPVDTRATNMTSSSFLGVDDSAVAVPLVFSPASSESSVVMGSSWNEPVVEKKRKKQDQNKSAALRYRQKKRCEHGTVLTECEELERRNIELKTKVSEMMKEVDYLKGLIEEICAA